MSPKNKNKSKTYQFTEFDMDDPKFRIKPTQQVTSAISGAIITSLFMTPLDVVKTRIQVQTKSLLSNKCYLYCNGLMDHLCPCGPNSPPPFATTNSMHLNGTYDALIKISRNEGIKSLWSGLGPTLISALPATVVYFVAYEQFKTRLKHYHVKYISKDFRNNISLPLYVPLLAGVSARILAVSVVSPLELIRTKMQSQRLNYKELRAAIQALVGAEGIRGLYKGLPPTIYRDVPFSGIYWTCYETVKAYFQEKEPSFGCSFIAGAIAGSIAALLTTPFDVIKTHQQIEFGEKYIYTDKPSRDIPKDSMFQSLNKLYTTHGIKGLFAGVGPRLAKVTPACAIMIASFEYGKSFFYKYNIQTYAEEHGLILTFNKSTDDKF